MASERVTENLTLNEMQIKMGENKDFYVYEQGDISKISKIDSILKQAGGKPKICELNNYSAGGSGKCQPEFIITFHNDRNTIIVIECKKAIAKHMSTKLNQPKDYAVDGVLYYAKFLKAQYNVIAIAISGVSKDNLKVTTYDWRKGQEKPQELKKAKDILYAPENYLKLINGEDIKKALSMEEIRDMALVMHNHLRNLKISEKSQPVFIAGILIALKDKVFSQEYISATSFNSLHSRLKEAINNVLQDSDIRQDKINDIKHHFELIGKNGKIKTIPLEENQSLLWFISELDKKIKPMMDYADITVDALGVFYHEFVKYSGGDGSGLGIVLTPQHLTEFMCELAQVNKNTKVLDICCGSGAFLVTAMSKMFENANDEDIERIKKNSLYGVEFDDDIYTLAIANMIVRGDGKSNIIYGDCFDKKIIQDLKAKNINVGLINPPYSQKDHNELEFVNNLLNILTTGGIGVAVVPMSCAIGTKYKIERAQLFENHSLKAVFTMPDDIFSTNNANTNVCVMVWEAHKPHNNNTYFGYYKNDGFVKVKKLGRIDKYNKWKDIKSQWLKNFEDRIIVPGISCLNKVDWENEWLCEAYMETDFTKLTINDFSKTVKKYCVYLLENGLKENISSDAIYKNAVDLDIDNWQWFNLNEILNFEKCKCGSASSLLEDGSDIAYIGAKKNDNGIMKFVKEDKKFQTSGNCITFICDGQGSVGYTNYQPIDFIGTTTVRAARSKFLNKYNALFLVTVLDLEKFKYNYGRKYKPENTKIKLPAIKNLEGNYELNWQYMEDYIKSLPYSSNL